MKLQTSSQKPDTSPEANAPQPEVTSPVESLPPEQATQTPGDTADTAVAAESGGEVLEDSTDSEANDKKALVIQKIKAMGTAVVHNPKVRRKAIGAVLATVVAIVGYQVYLFVYAAFLLSAGLESMENRQYRAATRYIEKYENLAERTDESALILMRSYLFSGDAEKAGSVANNYEGTSPEVFYIRAVAEYPTDPQKAIELLDMVIVSPEEEDTVSYLTFAHGVFALLQGEYRAANAEFAKLKTIPVEMDSVADRHLRALLLFFLNNTDIDISDGVPLSFDYPQTSDDNSLNFPISTEGYNNTFSIPLFVSALKHDISNTPFQQVVDGLRLLTSIRSNPDETQQLASFAAADSVLSKFITGYYQVVGGQYEAAAVTYRGISELDAANPLAVQYEGAAEWLTQNGDFASDRVLDLYKQALELNPDNIVALNNLAFLNFNLGNIDEAKSLINRAREINNVDPYVALNYILFGLSDNSLEIDNVVVLIDSLLQALPDSVLILNMATHTHMLNNDMFQAVLYAQKASNVDPDGGNAAIDVANLYRHQGDMLLAVTELEKAYIKFSGNLELAKNIAIYYALNNNPKAAARVLRRANIKSSSVTGLRVKSILESDKDLSSAIAAAEEALMLSAPEEKTEIAIELARLYLSAEEKDKASVIYEVAQTNAEYAGILDLTVIMQALERRIEAAQEVIDEATDDTEVLLSVAIKRQNIFAQIDLSWALIDLGKPEIAIQSLERIRQQQVKLPSLFSALIAGYKKTDQEHLIEDIERHVTAVSAGVERESERKTSAPKGNARDVFSSRVEALRSINQAIKGKDFERAIELYTALIESPISQVEKPALNFQNRGAIYMSLKRYEEAVADFAKALSMSDSLSEKELYSVHYNYVHALMRNKKYDKTKQEIVNFLDANEDFPHYRVYMRLLASAYSILGDHNESIEVYETLLAKYPRDISNYIAMGESALAVEDYNIAVKALTRGLEVDPKNIRIHQMLQNIYTTLGESANAARHRQFIKNIKSDS